MAARYTDSIVTYCENLQSLPHRGIQRDDIRPGLRITSYRKRVVIAFEVDADQVWWRLKSALSTTDFTLLKAACKQNMREDQLPVGEEK